MKRKREPPTYAGKGGENSVSALQPGLCIGRYRIERELGRGGSSIVYLAVDQHLGKKWAIKVLENTHEEGVTGKDAGNRRGVLLEEVELMKRLEHPALPRIVDILEKDGMTILIMDYVEGEDLASLLQRAGPFPESVVREWMYRLAAVLQYLHGQDPPVIYRDMKPANVIRRPDGSLVLLDLGIAREYKHGREQDTVALGTRGYAPPEQYGHAQTDVRSDIYSLGMTAAELLTGCSPDRDPYLYKTHPFRKLHPEISREFENILNRCLAFSPQERYSSCEELMRELRKRSAKAERKRPRCGKQAQCGKRPHVRLQIHTHIGKRGRVAVLAAIIVMEGAAVCYSGGVGPSAAQAETIQMTEPDRVGELRDLLERSSRIGTLSEQQSEALRQAVTGLPPEIRQDAGQYAGLCFEVACTYLYAYTGENGSFRSRVLQAQPYFEEALEILQRMEEPEDAISRMAMQEENDDGATQNGEAGTLVADGRKTGTLTEERVRSYVRLCTFFSQYVFDSEGVADPGPDACEDILEAVQSCLEERDVQTEEDGTWLQLLLLQSMEELLREYRQNFADAGIRQEKVLQVLSLVETRAAELPAKREKLRSLQEDVTRGCAACRDELGRTYENITKWKEAEGVYDGEKETGR